MIIAASAILLDNSDIPNLDEVRYYRAKAYSVLGNKEGAENDWQELSLTPYSAYSSEAKYMIAEIRFSQGMLSEAEDSVNSLLSSSNTDRYWVARGIILLSDISAKQGDKFKAKQYLNSLKSNYTDNDDIQTMIKTRLAKYEN